MKAVGKIQIEENCMVFAGLQRLIMTDDSYSNSFFLLHSI